MRPFFLSILTTITAASYAAALAPIQVVGLIKQFGADYSYPRVIDIAKNISYSGFATDVVGRVAETNAYIGAELNTEYIFGLFADLGQTNGTILLGVPLNQTIAELSIQGNIASFSVIVEYDWHLPQHVPVQIDVWFLYDEAGLIKQYDITFRRAAWAWDTMRAPVAKAIAQELNLPYKDKRDVQDGLLQKKAAIDVCNVYETYCTGANQQYKSRSACLDFVGKQVPLGELWQGGQNNALCRYIHKSMVKFRPDVHCPHIGPTGGGMCIARDYVTETLTQIYPVPFVNLTAYGL